MSAIIRVVLVVTMVVLFSCATALAQAADTQVRAEDDYLLAYLLDEPPSDISMSTLPTTARDVVIARVSLTRGPIYLVMREQSGLRSGPPPKYLFRSWLRVVHVLSGPATDGDDFDVTFGKPNHSGGMTMVPLRDEVSRDYFVIAYVDEDGQRHLAGYPINEAKYRAWEATAWKQIRTFR
jgi:hypothetical protein